MGCGALSTLNKISPSQPSSDVLRVDCPPRLNQVAPSIVEVVLPTDHQGISGRNNDEIVGHSQDSSGLFFREAVSNSTNLLAAVKRGDIQNVKLLVEAGADVNSRGMWSSTPLIIAAQYGYHDIVSFLLDEGSIDVNHLNEKGAGALLFACMEGNVDMVRKILQKAPNMRPPAAPSLYNPQIDKSISCTPMSIACVNGHVEIIEILLDSGCDLNERFNFSMTKSINIPAIMSQPLTIDTERGAGGAVGLTPVMAASAFGKASAVRALLQRGADCSLSDSELSSVLHHAARSGKAAADVFEEYRTGGHLDPALKLINALDGKGETPLHCTCEAKLLPVAKLLVDSGCDVNVRSQATGATPLHIAVKKRSPELVALLLDGGANPLIEDDKGVSPAVAVSQLRQDSPILARMEEAATAWRATRAIQTQAQALLTPPSTHAHAHVHAPVEPQAEGNEGGEGVTPVARVSVSGPEVDVGGASGHHVVALASSALGSIRTPNRNQREELIISSVSPPTGHGIDSAVEQGTPSLAEVRLGITPQLTQLADGIAFRQSQGQGQGQGQEQGQGNDGVDLHTPIVVQENGDQVTAYFTPLTPGTPSPACASVGKDDAFEIRQPERPPQHPVPGSHGGGPQGRLAKEASMFVTPMKERVLGRVATRSKESLVLVDVTPSGVSPIMLETPHAHRELADRMVNMT